MIDTLRRIPPPLIAVALAVLLLSGCRRPGTDASGMNLLVITLDTTRADAVGLYGGRPDVTPNIDALGRSGVVFERCYTPVPLTLPAHVSLFTGREPIAHLVRNNGTYVLGEGERTMAEMFRERGFRTAAVIASFTVASKFGLAQGFESYDEEFEIESAFQNFLTEIPADRVFEKFVRWLDGKEDGRFFSWVHFYDPHFPYVAHPDAAGPPAVSNRDLYLDEVRYVDRHVGRIVEALRDRRLYESTLIIIVGDHGEAFGEHGEFGHGIFCYEESLRVPLVFHNPRLFPRSRTVTEPVGLVDIMPTVAELFRAESVHSAQGRSLLAALEGRKGKPRGPLYFESLFGQEKNNWAPLTGFIAGRAKFISLPDPELYDLEQDGRETRNLVAERPEEARELDRRLAAYVLEHGSSGSAGRRELTEADRRKLTALGYVSAFSGRAREMIDPKTGIAVYGELAEIKNVIGAGDLRQAKARLKAVLEKAPGLDLPDIRTIRYELLSREGDRKGAIAVLEQAVEDYPGIESFKLSLLAGLMSANRWEEAAGRAGRFLQEDERMTAAWVVLGEIDTRSGRFEAAIGNYRKALDLEPDNSMVRIKLAASLAAGGDLTQAETILAELESHPRVTAMKAYGSTISELGYRFYFSGQKERGLDWMRKACATAPNEPEVWINRGVVHFTERDFDAALADYGKALEVDPASARAHSNLGIYFFSRFIEVQDPSLLDRSLAAFNTAIRYDPDQAPAYYGRGAAHFSWGELDPAVKDFRRAIELDPSQGDAYIQIARALQLLGRYDEALSYLDRFKNRFYWMISPAERQEVDRLYNQTKLIKGIR